MVSNNDGLRSRSMMMRFGAGLMAALVLAGCSDNKNLGNRTTVLNTKPAIFLRASPDGDASQLIGSFLPDEVADADVDEGSAVRTRCSEFIKAKRIPANGEFTEIASASSGASGSIGVKSIAKVEMGGKTAEALMVRYSLIEKMDADVDEAGLQQCCSTAPDQCSKRYIAGALMADGNYYAATDANFDAGVDLEALKLANLPIDASVVYEQDMKWERKVAFKRQYFAFNVKKSLAGGLGGPVVATNPNDCSWANNVPKDLDGVYFVGVSNPMPTEKLAREDAMRDARDQVIKYLGEFLQEADQSVKKTVGSAADIQVLMDNTQVREAMSGGLAKSVKDQKWCGPIETASPSGMKATMKALAYFPNSERKSAGIVAIKSMIERQKAAKMNTAALEQLLMTMEGAK
jgi:hypothetical protein